LRRIEDLLTQVGWMTEVVFRPLVG